MSIKDVKAIVKRTIAIEEGDRKALSANDNKAIELLKNKFSAAKCYVCGRGSRLRTGLIGVSPVFFCWAHDEQYRKDKRANSDLGRRGKKK